jgi:hypothetical protein
LCDGGGRVDAHLLRIRSHDPVQINARREVFEDLLLECLDFLELDLRAFSYLFR